MAGFLDSYAPSITAEYTRYVEGDALGKIIFKNFLLHRVGLPERDIYIPRGRHGDVESDRRLLADVQICVDGSWKDIEIKCARINIANRFLGAKNENWGFISLLTTGRIKQPKSYDIAIAIAVQILGHEEPGYWSYLEQLASKVNQKGTTKFTVETMPHEEAYLNICGFFILPYAEIETDYFRVNRKALGSCRYARFFAWGHETDRCREIWESAGRLSLSK